jgi:hypothetical protein
VGFYVHVYALLARRTRTHPMEKIYYQLSLKRFVCFIQILQYNVNTIVHKIDNVAHNIDICKILFQLFRSVYLHIVFHFFL